MKRLLLLTTILLLSLAGAFSQNVFDPNDPLIRYDANQPLGSAQKPDPAPMGLQKWVSIPSNGISTGGGSYDVSSYKAYFINIGSIQMSFRLKFPKSFSNPDSASKKYPLALFFHGAGEFACPSNGGLYNNEKQLVHGGKLFRDRVDNNQFDGFLLYPQLYEPAGCWGNWGSPTAIKTTVLFRIIDSLAKYVRADIDRVFAFGLSAGGVAAFNATHGQPLRIAKAAPAAAVYSNNYDPATYVHIPIWFATGGKDTNPTPATAEGKYNTLKGLGGDYRYTLYPTLGHAVWNTLWNEPDFIPYMNDMHKANPLVFFQRSEFCPDSVISARIGVVPGFYEYEWQKDGVTIARRINGVNTVLDPAPISSFSGNEMVVKQFGTYRVRFKRTAASEYSAWSPKPAVIKPKAITQTPPIEIDGMHSKVLPAPDGSTTVPLKLPLGYSVYEWFRVSDNALVSNQAEFNAPVGQYHARTKEEFGCGSELSVIFKVVSANGSPKPEPAKNLNAFAVSQTAIQLDWNENPNAGSNETGFEIYRSTTAGGPYTLIHVTAPNVVTYTDQNLPSNVKYFYLVRAVNEFGAAANSNETFATTTPDNIAPTAPTNVLYRGATLNGVSLRWNTSTDNVGVVRYDVYSNNQKLYSTKQNSVTVFGLDSLTNYTFFVKAIDAAGNESAPSSQVIGYTHRQGLNYKYYHGEWSTLPNFNNLTPIKTGTTDTINNGISFRTRGDNYAIMWEGFIYIPVAGTYRFETGSDDGSKLYIDVPYSNDAQALVNNDGLHGTQYRTGTITLTQGYHSIVATFFERTGGDVMEVLWTNTEAGITRERIPKGYFAREPNSGLVAPALPSGLNASASGFDRITLTWTDNSTDETGFELTRSATSNGTYVPVGTVAANITSFTDSGLTASTAYYYKLRTISNSGESTYIGPATATTNAPPPPPAVPTGLTATVLGVDAIQLEFTDASSNETGFEIWRSVGNNTNFRRIAILPAGSGGSITHTDLALFANITYYYKVLATGVGSNSPFTPEINARTLNTAPEMTHVLDFTMKYGTTFTLPIKATDKDGDPLTFTTQFMPAFATRQDVSNGNVNFIFNPRLSNQGAYTISITVSDGNGGTDATYFTLVVDDNAVPVLGNIENVVMNEGESKIINLSASDLEGNSGMQWTHEGMPLFGIFSSGANGTGQIILNPGYSQSGEYTTTVFVDDGFGGWTSRTFNITVVEKDPNEKVQVNMKLFNGNVPLWNDIQLQEDGTASLPTPRFNVTDLTNTFGENSGIGVTVESGTYRAAQTSAITGNNTGVYPDNVLRDEMHWGFFTNNNLSDTVVLKISGLSQVKKYNFVLFAGYNCTNCGNNSAVVTFKSDTQVAQIRYWLNTSVTDTLYAIDPDQDGNAFITMIGDPNVNWGGMLNALVIDAAYDDGTVPAKPLDLAATAINNAGVQLNWVDRSYNETNYTIYRSANPGGPFTIVNLTGNYKDSTGYLDGSVDPFTTYYYFVTGINAVGQGEHSDTVSVVTYNNKPVISELGNIYVKTDDSAVDDFVVSDDPGEVFTVSLIDQPGFVTLQDLGSGNYRLTASPTNDNVGWHELTVRVEDEHGAATEVVVRVSVADKLTRSAYINLGPAGLPASSPWNNWTGARAAGNQLNNLRDENNATTPWYIRCMNKWYSVSELGMITGNNSGVFPDDVLEGAIVSNNDTTVTMQFLIGGLNPAMRYNIIFGASVNEGYDVPMVYWSGSEIDTLDAKYNTSRTANLNGLIPGSTGQITVNIRKTLYTTGVFGFLNGIVIEEFNPATLILSPSNLEAEPLNRTSVRLTWNDRAYNENASNGFELQRATDSLFTQSLVTISLPSYVNEYNDNNVQANTKYWYRVRALTGIVYSDFSNRALAITPQSIVYVNFNYQVNNAPAPWNNLESLPDVVDPFFGMTDQSGNNTGIALAIERIFNGEFNAGKTTGNNSGIAPDNVLQANFWIDNTQLSQIKVSGLNHSKKYRFGFIGSSGPAGWYRSNYTATYSIGDRTVYLNSWENTEKIVYIGDVSPDEFGEVMVDFSTTDIASYGFNAGMVIMAYDDLYGGSMPNAVRPVPQDIAVVNTRSAAGDPSVQQVKAYPNPFAETFNLEFFNNSSLNAIGVDIVDLSGRIVYRKQYGQVPAGNNTLRITTSDQSFGPGLYLVNLTSNGKRVSTVKMVKTK